MSESLNRRLVDQIYFAASELDGDERIRYLDAHCPNQEVRSEVERILGAAPPDSFLGRPVVNREATQLQVGDRLGHFEIQSKLGQGGMGWVYQALDQRLNRVVALKVLPPGEYSGDEARRRLVREAEAASALNHPNIVTVYEVGRVGSIDFIAMERVNGKTLRQLIGHKGMPLREVIPLAIQIAEALRVAHEAGVVHRDFKPGNVMVSDRGLVKVLDFGLAKRMTPSTKTGSRDATLTMTVPGAIFGTYAYMSPEQAEGKPVDMRSDIFSFGVVLYEMLTGKKAFAQENSIRTLAAVVGKEPPPARDLVPSLPQGVERILEKCLRKNLLERWQNITDVKLLLEDALRDIEATREAAAPVNRRRWREVAAAAAGAALLTGLAMWSFRPPLAPRDDQDLVVRRLTTDAGLSGFPDLSRDGTMLAFASDRSGDGNLDIWMLQIGGGDPIRLTRDAADETDPSISPDGTRVAFRSERDGGGVYVAPALGGEPVLVAPGGHNPRFSPDGRYIAYWAGRDAGGYVAGSAKVFVVEAGGGQARQIQPGMAAAMYPIWSPDGENLLVLGRRDGNLPLQASVDWWLLPLEQGAPVKTGALAQIRRQGLVLSGLQANIIPLAWRTDGRDTHALFAARRGDAGNLWALPLKNGIATGPIQRLTMGPGSQMQASLAPLSASGRVALANLEWNFDVWSLDLDTNRGIANGDLKRLTKEESLEAQPALDWAGRRMVYVSRQAGKWLLRTMDFQTGKDVSMVSRLKAIFAPRLSSDGSRVAYSDDVGNIYSTSIAGGVGEDLCQKCGTVTGVSGDGNRILYEPMEVENVTLVSRDTRKSTIVVAQPDKETILSGAQFSRDGNWLAFHALSGGTNTSRIWIIPTAEPYPVPPGNWIAVTDGKSQDLTPVWSPSGNLVYYITDRDGFRCVWARALDPLTKRPSGDPFAVRHFHTARLSLRRSGTGVNMIGLAVGGERAVMSFGELTGNIWLLEKAPVKSGDKP